MKILKALWLTNSSVGVSLSVDSPSVPEFEIRSDFPMPAHKVSRAPKELFNKYCSYYIEGENVHFLLNAENFDNVSLEYSDYYVCGSFNDWNKAIGDPNWKMKRLEGEYVCELSVPISELQLNRGGALFKFASYDGRWLEPRAESSNAERDDEGNLNFRIKLNRTGENLFVIDFAEPFDMRAKVSVCFNNSCCEIDAGELLRQIYSPHRLGAYRLGSVTEFALFAPRAKLVYLGWYSPDAPEEVHLLGGNCVDGAVWVARADRDLCGKYYFWRVMGANVDSTTDFNSKFNIADPYANAMLSSNGPSIVVYDEDLPKPKIRHNPPSWHDLVVMEIHLRDVLSKSDAKINPDERGGFAGLTKWLESPDCYLRKTGVNCVELQPIQEFTAEKKSDYEWGYMPVNWFAPASSYATNPACASQNKEFAELVDAFHRAGISVILDVVYNHIGEPNFLLKIDKEYYFEMAADGGLVNHSGCGNDFFCRAPMAFRMITDSLKRLILNYGVDGFRFDLAELMGVKVLREIEVELKKVKPSVILIAEPWSFRGHIARQLTDSGFSSWNDGFREFILQYTKGEGKVDGLKYFLSGSLGGVAKWPAQTVNYVESHDDMCFFDRVSTNWRFPSIDDVRRYKLAYALVLLSLGIPMVAEGFDFLRTKKGANNTYKDGETNAIDYVRGESFTGLRTWLRRLVQFRLSPCAACLRLSHSPDEKFFKFFAAADGKCAGVIFNADNSIKSPKIFAAFNPTVNFSQLPVGDLQGFVQIADIDRFDSAAGLEDPLLPRNGVLNMPPLSLVVFKQ